VLLAEVGRVEGILGAYLDFSRPIEALKVESFAVEELVNSAVEVVDARAQRQGVEVRASGPAVQARGDRRRLLEALLNLLTNALEAGARRVEVRWGPEGEGLALRVQDDGRGMGPEALSRLGTPFVTTREGGTGLGVVLARAAARQHGGELRYESEAGRGTVATLELPAELIARG